MKKLFTLSLLLCAATIAIAQTSGRNLFDASDIDENGWIWFDTAEKIDKYIGVINETDYVVDPEGKPIQLVYADIFPDYPASEVSEEFIGAGTDGETGSEGSRTGAIMLQPSSGSNIDGGGFIVRMPSCYSYAICYSSNSKVMARILATTNDKSAMSQWHAEGSIDNENGWRVISATYTTIFKRLPAGINKWEGLEELNNGYEPIVTMQSNEPINVWFQNGTRDTVYIHGMKVITQEEDPSEIVKIDALQKNGQEVYTMDGRRVNNSFADVNKGLYIVTEQGRTRKVIK